MKTTITTLSIFFAALVMCANVYGQCDSTAQNCKLHLRTDFISDGQQYRALLTGDEIAEFEATFFGGSKYRICGCSGLSDGNLIFRVFDSERNLIFSNNDHKNAPYWNFEFTSTMDCIIEAQLEPLAKASGCAMLLIGFER